LSDKKLYLSLRRKKHKTIENFKEFACYLVKDMIIDTF